MVTNTTTPRKKATAAKSDATSSATASATPTGTTSGFDFSKLDPRNFELPDFGMPDFGMPKFDVPSVDTDKLFAAIRDAAYITVGFGVLAVQQANARRQDLAAMISERFGSSATPVNKAQVEAMIQSFEAGIVKLGDQFEARLDTTVGTIESHLPAAAGDLLTKAHGAAKTVRQQVRSLVLTTA